ncbi:MAG: SCO family protein [Verrucomicrobiota bacterium]|nr:SCO family protein [Verrucomicrobiota bacterium]
MKPISKTVQVSVWGGVLLTVVLIFVLFLKERKTTVASSSLPVLSQVPEFTLTNQHGVPITLADLKGRVWIADIVFSRCAGPCPKMTQTMSGLQGLWGDQPVSFVTLTTDPEFDTSDVLKKFGEQFGAVSQNWLFLTGPKREIAKVAIEGLKLTAVEKPEPDQTNDFDLFIHSTSFVLVDKQGQVRGWRDQHNVIHAGFDSTDPNLKAQIKPAVEALLKE